MRFTLKRVLVVVFPLFFLALVGGYALYEFRAVLSGPKISIDSPLDGATLTNPLVSILGSAQYVAHIRLNGRPIFIDQEGSFHEEILLQEGYNTVSVAAEDKFGTKKEILLRLFFQKK